MAAAREGFPSVVADGGSRNRAMEMRFFLINRESSEEKVNVGGTAEIFRPMLLQA